MLENYLDVMSGMVEVDKVLSECEQIGKELSQIMKIWAEQGTTGGAPAPTADVGLALVAIPEANVVERASASSDPIVRKAFEGYLREQPEGVPKTIVLKDYQMLGVNWLNLLYHRKTSCILADEMGESSLPFTSSPHRRELTLCHRRTRQDGSSHRSHGALQVSRRSGTAPRHRPLFDARELDARVQRLCAWVERRELLRESGGASRDQGRTEGEGGPRCRRYDVQYRYELAGGSEVPQEEDVVQGAFLVSCVSSGQVADGLCRWRSLMRVIRFVDFAPRSCARRWLMIVVAAQELGIEEVQGPDADQGAMATSPHRHASPEQPPRARRTFLSLPPPCHARSPQLAQSLLSFILPDQFRDANESLRAIFKVGPGSQANLLSRERISRAKKMMTPFVLRRKKAQVLKDLPSKSERVEWCDMTDLQREVYNEAITRSKKALLELPDDEIEVLGEAVDEEEGEKPKPKKKGPRASSTKTGNKSDGNASSNVLMDLRKGELVAGGEGTPFVDNFGVDSEQPPDALPQALHGQDPQGHVARLPQGARVHRSRSGPHLRGHGGHDGL